MLWTVVRLPAYTAIDLVQIDLFLRQFSGLPRVLVTFARDVPARKASRVLGHVYRYLVCIDQVRDCYNSNSTYLPTLFLPFNNEDKKNTIHHHTKTHTYQALRTRQPMPQPSTPTKDIHQRLPNQQKRKELRLSPRTKYPHLIQSEPTDARLHIT